MSKQVWGCGRSPASGEHCVVNHEKLLHLIMVNHDLSFFSHIHPEFKGDGTFTVNTSFPASGDYKVLADFIPTGLETLHKLALHFDMIETNSLAIRSV
ncbi:hypothetical protein [Cohnella sp. GbtcB17]|uniref:hypothetical protein n=1 Tax=Cohnella sp. GbtcB17 TaxID=2824762 RepID=UPI001C30754F|nr:hypothetical protein [Cohnella sp. GbtcB17]